ncbi:hypothetical protein JNB62_10680 [Microbacterium jejuense]|uniref:Glycosyl transferase family 2 n=1 Tax=Microbacterium jejuense TaxID=1263637 RepID=A0ABS7HQI1_9MICO|nr:hypothetical protein [Microbacterium jejuense]MBW9094148.1 hypothetical protein [Microbacterium jejuense]
MELLLEQTLRSVCSQTDQDYVVVVVGNQRPSFALPSQVHFVPVEFPPPITSGEVHAPRDAFVRDKGTKIAAGLIAARRFQPDQVMIFDADDFVSRRLAEHVKTHASSPGWVISEGWMYSRARNVYRPVSDFNRTCGTSFIVPYEAYRVSADIRVDASQDELIAAFGDVLTNIMGAHRGAVEWHRARGRELEILPFRGAVYHVDTGENHSGKSLRGVAFPSSRRFREEFGVPRVRGRVWTALSAFGPIALMETMRAKAVSVAARLSKPFARPSR